MHGDLEPEEHHSEDAEWFDDDNRHVNDLYEDMDRLNALYEELMWPHDDALEFVADYENDRIIIRRLRQDD